MNVGDQVKSKQLVHHSTENFVIPVGASANIVDCSYGIYLLIFNPPLPGFEFCSTFEEHLDYFWEPV